MEHIGRYKVLQKIGSGGMAEIVLARSRGAQGTEKLLVLKKIHPILARNNKFISMFIDEARVAMRLNHTNIVHTYAFEQVEETYILAMEYVDGSDLLALEKIASEQGQPIPGGIAAYIIAEAAKGLDYAHTRTDDRGDQLEIVHRDVSPQNIMLSREGAVKITDFGIAGAKWLHDKEQGGVRGKWGYMPPEQAAGRPVDRRADVYALGIVLHEMLIGQSLKRIEEGEDPKQAILSRPVPAPQSQNSAVPDALNEIVIQATAVDPDDRFSSAREMARALSRYLHAEPEIYDAQSLESWLTDLLPVSPTVGGLEKEPENESSILKPIPGPATTSAEDVTVVERAFGEVEHRPIVVISADLQIGDQPESENLRKEYLQLVDEIAYKSEAMLEDLGDRFRLILGLHHPTTDDAIRALRLAHDIHDAARGLSRDQRIDIDVRLAVGRGNARILQSADAQLVSFRLDRTVEQEAADLLRTAEPGMIVADGQIFKFVRKDYNFAPPVTSSHPPPDPMLTDEQLPVQSYQVLRAKSRRERSREAPVGGSFHGRGLELQSLNNSLRSCLAGELTLVRAVGEPGIGKSRLIRRFLGLQQPGAFYVLESECLFVERDEPLAAASALLRVMLDVESDSELDSDPTGEPSDLDEAMPLSRDHLRAKLQNFLAEAPAYLGRQERFFTDLLPSPESVWFATAEGKRALIRRIASGMGVLLELIARKRPVVIVVENAHWLDGPSIDILAELAGRRAKLPILVLLVGQAATLSGRRIPGLRTLDLADLPETYLRHIITDRLGVSDHFDGISEQIVARAKGNPFFTNEIIDSLIERGILVPSENGDAKYRQARSGSIRLPATVKVVAVSRIDNLPIEQRTVLRAASAVGAEFSAAIVARLVGRDVERELRSLVETGLILKMDSPSDGLQSFRFRHPLTRDAAYDGLPPRDRNRIHRRMADELIAAVAAGESVPKSRVAWHLERCGDKQLAGAYYRKAGDVALTFFSSRQAIKLYDRAIGLIDENSEDQFEVIYRREQLLAELGYHEQREKDVTALERVSDQLEDMELRARASNRRAKLHFDIGDTARAATTLAHSLEYAARGGNTGSQIEALRQLVQVAAESGHLIRSLSCCDRALGIIPPDHAHYLRARIQSIRGYVLLNMGHLDAAAPALAEALVLFRRLGKRRNESTTLSNLALLASARGELSEGIDFMLSALRMDTEIRDRSARGRKLASIGQLYTEIGDFASAEANLGEAREICRENMERIGEVETELAFAEMHLSRDEPHEARVLLEATGRMEALTNSRLLVVRQRQFLAITLYRLQEYQGARQLIEEAKQIAYDAGINGEVVHCGVLHGLIYAAVGLPGEAQAISRRATDLLGHLGKIRNPERIWWLQAKTLRRIGNMQRADRALHKAQAEITRKRALIFNPYFSALFDQHPSVQRIINGF